MTDDDTAGDSDGFSRRSVLQSVAMGAAAGGSAAGLADVSSATTEPSVLVDPDDLGSWVVMRNHEVPAYTGTVDNPPVANIDGRIALRTVYGLSHVNTKVPDGTGDVARGECNGQPGVQHRFVATTFTMGRLERPDGTTPVKAVDGLSIQANGPASSCGSVSFALNNAFQHRTSTAAFHGSGSSDFGEYGGDDLRSKVDGEISNSKINASPSRPNDPKPAKEAAELVFNTALVLAAGSLGPIGAAAIGLSQSFVVGGLVDLLFETCDYEPTHQLHDDWVRLEQDHLSCSSGERYTLTNGSAALNVVDFTITVPPGTRDQFTVQHRVDYSPIDHPFAVSDDDTQTTGSVSIGDGTDTENHMMGRHSWTVDVPGIDLGTSTDSLGSGSLPAPVEDYDTAPDPGIELRGTASLDDLSEDDTVTFEATGVDDPAEARWRLYRRDTDTIRPAIDYGTEFTWLFDQEAEFTDDALEDPTFGSGEYAVEFIAFADSGTAGTARREFSVASTGPEDPPTAKIALTTEFGRSGDEARTDELDDFESYNGIYRFAGETLNDSVGKSQLDETITFDGRDSVDGEPGDFTGQSDSIDNYVWYVETPEGVDDVWKWGRDPELDLTVEEPGTYTVELTIVTFQNSIDGLRGAIDDEILPDGLLNDDGTPPEDRSDRTVLDEVKTRLDNDVTQVGTYDSSVAVVEQNAPPKLSLDAPEKLDHEETGTFDATESKDPDGEIERYGFGFVPPEEVDQENPPETEDDLGNVTENRLRTVTEGEPVVEESFEKPGIWALLLQAEDDRGVIASELATFQVGSSLAPSISVASQTVAAGSEIEFTGLTGDEQEPYGLDWEWTFDGPYGDDAATQPDTETATGREVEHTFDEPGTYTVTLAVTGEATRRTSIEMTVEPSIDPRIEVLSDPVTVTAPVRLEAASDLPTGVVDWEWFVQDPDDPFANLGEDSGLVEATGRVVGIEFDDPGEYEVVARGRRDDLVATTTKTLTVDPGGVNAVAERVGSDSLYVDPDEEATFTALDSYDTDGEIASYTWYVDGEREKSGPDAVQFSHSFSEDGGRSKPVAVVVEDEDGNTDRDDVPILVHPDEDRFGPDAALTVLSPESETVAPGTTVTFSASATSDPNGDIEDYVWRVDDDVVRRADATDAFDERTPPDRFEYSFEAPSDGDADDHSVSVLVRDADGFTDSAAVSVTVGTGQDGEDGDDGEDDDGYAGTEVIERDRRDGTVYQTGRLTETPDSVAGGDEVSVTGRVEAETDGAETNVVQAVLGFADGTVLDVTQMPGLGTGSVTNEATVPVPEGERTLVWSFYAARTASVAKTAFGNEADRDALAKGPYGIVVGTVDGSGAPSGFNDSFDYPSSELSANGWTTQLGGFVTDSGALAQDPDSQGYRSENSHPQELATGTFEFSGVKNPAEFYGLKVGFIADSTDFDAFDGYRIIWRQTRFGEVRLQRVDSGTATDLVVLTDDHGGNTNSVRIERSIRDDGEYEFECYYDGSKVGTVVDSTYTQSSNLLTRFDADSMRIGSVSVER